VLHVQEQERQARAGTPGQLRESGPDCNSRPDDGALAAARLEHGLDTQYDQDRALAATANQSEPENSDNDDEDDEDWGRRVGRRVRLPRGASAASALVIEEAEEDGEPASGEDGDSELDATQLDAENEDDHS
jgi:hypothetical protein